MTESSTSGVDPHEQVQAVITLRSGKIIEKPIDPRVDATNDRIEPKVNEEEKGKEEEKLDRKKEKEETKKESEKEPNEGHVVKPVDNPVEYMPRPPFPQRLARDKNEMLNSEIYETFKQVRINIPLLEAIKQNPSYAKFLKDMCTIKRKLNVKEEVMAISTSIDFLGIEKCIEPSISMSIHALWPHLRFHEPHLAFQSSMCFTPEEGPLSVFCEPVENILFLKPFVDAWGRVGVG